MPDTRTETVVDSLKDATAQWRHRLLLAEGREAGARRRGRLCKRRINQLRSSMTALHAELNDLEQQAATALKARDRERARLLSERIRRQDAAVRLAVTELRQLESRQRRLTLLERCWGWRADQHRRTGHLLRQAMPVRQRNRSERVTGGAIGVR